MIERQMQRLAQAGIRLLPAFQIPNHYVFERDGFVALVERRADGGFGGVGAPGLLSGGAIAMLVWKRESPVFVAKGKEWPATEAQVEGLRSFGADVRRALGAEEPLNG